MHPTVSPPFFSPVRVGAGFINLPLSKFEDWNPKLIGDDPILDKDKEIVIMCHHGMRLGRLRIAAGARSALQCMKSDHGRPYSS